MSESSDQVGADELQEELRDLLCLAVVGDHVRWVVTGADSGAFAQWLADASAKWREWADQVAKHLATLGVAPDGRVRSLAKDIPFNWVPDGWLPIDEAERLVTDRLGTVGGWARTRRSQVTDAGILRLLDTVCSGLEAQVESLQVARRP